MFGTSGIRGEVGSDVTAALALSVGRALASEGHGRVVVGRDTRESGVMLGDALSAGLRECGADVIDVGTAATPTIARSVAWQGADVGVSVTASHNPPEDNGLKLWNPSGKAFDADQRTAIQRRVEHDRYDPVAAADVGTERQWAESHERHVQALRDACRSVGDLHVVVDVGNGAGTVTADALRALGADVTTLNADPDGRFPARPSEPTVETCHDLRQLVEMASADLGIAHDGDADRMMAVDGRGNFVPGDYLLALFARENASAGDDVAAPLNTSLVVDDALEQVDASVVRTRVGDVFVAQRTTDESVVFGGEPSGAWIWPGETLCPDGPLAACRLAESVHTRGPLASQIDGIGGYATRRKNVPCSKKEQVVEAVQNQVQASYDRVDSLDGVRVDLDDGWFLVRASGTQPLVRITAEAREEQRADDIFQQADEFVSSARA